MVAYPPGHQEILAGESIHDVLRRCRGRPQTAGRRSAGHPGFIAETGSTVHLAWAPMTARHTISISWGRWASRDTPMILLAACGRSVP